MAFNISFGRDPMKKQLLSFHIDSSNHLAITTTIEELYPLLALIAKRLPRKLYIYHRHSFSSIFTTQKATTDMWMAS